MLILDGKKVAQAIKYQLKSEIEEFQTKYGIVPGLAVILVGDDPSSAVYVRNKVKDCKSIGIDSFSLNLPANSDPQQLYELIDSLNHDKRIHGLLVQLPLPDHFDTERVLEHIDPRKDVDCFTYENLGRMWTNNPLVLPCTPQGVMAILDYYQIDLTGKNCVVIGRSNNVGKPMSHLLLKANATVTTCHSKTKNLSEITQQADLVVVAAGKPRFLGRHDFKQEAIVVDVGIHQLPDNKLCGDVRFEECIDWVAAATPVPGGVGPMTRAMLLKNTLHLANCH